MFWMEPTPLPPPTHLYSLYVRAAEQQRHTRQQEGVDELQQVHGADQVGSRHTHVDVDAATRAAVVPAGHTTSLLGVGGLPATLLSFWCVLQHRSWSTLMDQS